MLPVFKLPNRILIARDTLFVLRGLWFQLFINCLAVWILLVLPQGTDILQILLEDSFHSLEPLSVFFLCFAAFCWCISSEFCARFLLYMTDNSGHSLSPERVRIRKRIQVLIARFFLFSPLFLLSIGLIKAYIQNQSDARFPLGVLLSILLVLAAEYLSLQYLYHPMKKMILTRKISWFHLTQNEKFWTGKLFGIFNDYRIDLPKRFIWHNTTDDLPRDRVLPNGAYIPKEFQLILRTEKNKLMQVWMYRIPLSFYKNLLKQLFILSGSAAFLILFFACLNTSVYHYVGSAALLCFSFACWQPVYLFIHFLDKAQPIQKIKLTYRLLLFIWIIGCTYVNSDHPVRIANTNNIPTQLSIPTHFEKWVIDLKATNKNDTIPLLFIAAEGGALRTGAFTALLLSKLQDSFPEFKQRVYAYSTVSGGGLGAHFFNSINQLSPSLKKGENARVSRLFFASDFLSAVIGKLVFGEILQWLIPVYIPLFDRAITLEKLWEKSWQSATNKELSYNVFAKSITQNQHNVPEPAYFINTVESETGMPCIWSNVILDSSFPFSEDRNLQKRFPVQLRYSTAINLSTRFPIISPAGMFCYYKKEKKVRRHFVDGGYFDNSGQETLLQLLKSIPFEKYPTIKPYVLCFNFSESDSSIGRGIHFANELVEIAEAIYQTRNARTLLASDALKRYCNNTFSADQYIALSLDINTKKLPMNWTLSHTALQRVNRYTDDLMQQKKYVTEMKKLFKAISYPIK